MSAGSIKEPVVAPEIDEIGLRRVERRMMLRRIGAIGLAAGLAPALSACGASGTPTPTPSSPTPTPSSPTPTPTPTSSPTPTPTPSPTPTSTPTMEEAYLNFLLNVSYLQAQFFSQAVLGVPLDPALTNGTGTPGAATGARQVTFSNSLLVQPMREIANAKIAQIALLRSYLGGAANAQPALNLASDTTGAFTKIARFVGLPPQSGGAPFDPYDSDTDFLLAAFVLTCIYPRICSGALYGLTDQTHLAGVGGIMNQSAYAAEVIRRLLYELGDTTIRGYADKLVDYYTIGQQPGELGLIDSSNANSLILIPDHTSYGVGVISYQHALNILYIAPHNATSGGFYPNGVNGTLNTSDIGGP